MDKTSNRKFQPPINIGGKITSKEKERKTGLQLQTIYRLLCISNWYIFEKKITTPLTHIRYTDNSADTNKVLQYSSGPI